jgi:hypothetical protein
LAATDAAGLPETLGVAPVLAASLDVPLLPEPPQPARAPAIINIDRILADPKRD